MKTIYLDHAATTPLRDEVLDAMLPHLRETTGNPSSIHHIGRTAYDVLAKARGDAAQTLGVAAHEVIFTGGGTEANNLALFGVARAMGARGRHILVSSIEHKSVLMAAEQLSHEGYEIEYIPVNHFGMIDVDDVLTRVRPDTILISIMYANNEIGTIEPIQELSDALNKKYTDHNRPLLHTDACQATGQLLITPHLLGVDLMTINSGKIYGPKGVGLLYVRDGVRLLPHTVGGDQEFGRRAGTENIPGIVGFVKALELAVSEQNETAATLTKLRDTFLELLNEEFPTLIVNGHPTRRLPNNVHISFPHIEGESLVLLLDTTGICAATGSACNARDLLPSHVLRAIGQSPELIHGSLRLTLGRDTTEEDLRQTVSALKTCVERLRTISPLPLMV